MDGFQQVQITLETTAGKVLEKLNAVRKVQEGNLESSWSTQ